MKREKMLRILKSLTFLIWMFVFITITSCNKCCKNEPINLLSYNIRFDNPDDGVNSWPNRKEKVAALIKFHDVDIACLQEVLHQQLIDLDERLPHLSWVGAGRDDGKQQGEFAPILFDNQKFQLLGSGWFWLSETPDVPSMGWDAACIRICTWLKLKCMANSIELFVFNTHFDHVGKIARQNSAQLIIHKINEIANGYPIVLAGDFNALPHSDAIKAIAEKFSDSYLTSIEPPYGPIGTWNAFDYNSMLDQRIDYIFTNERIKVIKYGNLTDSEEQRFPSDHLPVFIKTNFNKL
jgi:endonuclease/exonuclease/phosphatase family metal-dependent hydrolase